jgi:hypothetical protein
MSDEKKRVGDDFPDPMDGHPVYEENFLDMSKRFWEKEDPAYYKLMMRLNGADKGTT